MDKRGKERRGLWVISTQGNGLLSPKVIEVRCEVNFPYVNHSHLGYLGNVLVS